MSIPRRDIVLKEKKKTFIFFFIVQEENSSSRKSCTIVEIVYLQFFKIRYTRGEESLSKHISYMEIITGIGFLIFLLRSSIRSRLMEMILRV